MNAFFVIYHKVVEHIGLEPHHLQTASLTL